MVIFPPEKLHVSPPPILNRIAHVFLQSCQDCIDFRLWGGNLHFPPFDPLLPSAILLFLLASAPLSAIPPPFFSSSLSGPRIVFRRSLNQSQFCNPTFSSSLQSCNPAIPKQSYHEPRTPDSPNPAILLSPPLPIPESCCSSPPFNTKKQSWQSCNPEAILKQSRIRKAEESFSKDRSSV